MRMPAEFRIDVQAYDGQTLLASINPNDPTFREFLRDLLVDPAVLEAIKEAAWQTTEKLRGQ